MQNSPFSLSLDILIEYFNSSITCKFILANPVRNSIIIKIANTY